MADLKIQMMLDLKPFSAGLTSALKMGQSFQDQFKKLASGVQVKIDESAFKKEIANLDKIYAGFRSEAAKKDIKINGEAKQAVAAAKQAEQAIKKVPVKKDTTFSAKVADFLSPIRKVTDSIASIGVALGAVFIGFKKIITIGKDWVNNANTQEAADRKLLESLKNNNAYSEAFYHSLLNEASALQAVTKSGDDQNEMLMTLAINMGVSQDKIVEVTRGAIGLSTQFAEAGLSQELALKGIALAYEGNWMQLTRYIPELRNAKDQTERMAVLQKGMVDGFKLANAAAEVAEGLNIRYANAVGDVKEKLGAMINSGLVPFKRGLLEAITPAQKQIDQFEVQRSKAADLKIEFDDLTGTLTYLTEKGKLNDEEMKIKADTIVKLNDKFPNYFSNLETAAKNNDTLKDAINGAREKLVDYTNQMIETAVIQKYTDQIVGLSAKIIQNRTTIAELEIANSRLANSITTDTTQHQINENQVRNNNLVIEAARRMNEGYAAELDQVRNNLKSAREEAQKYTAAIAPSAATPTPSGGGGTNLTADETKAQDQLNQLLAQRAGLEQEIIYWQNEKARITGDDYQSQLKRLQIDQQIADLQTKSGTAQMAQYDQMQTVNTSFYQRKMITEEQYQQNRYTIMQMAYDEAVTLYGTESDQAIDLRQKVLDFEAAANQKEIDLQRDKIRSYQNAANATLGIMQGFANAEAAQRQAQYDQNLARMQSETENKIIQWQSDLERGKISQEQYDANIAQREADEENLTITYESQAKKRSEIEKATAIAQTTMATYEMATKAYKAMAGIPIVGPVLGGIAAAAAIALGMKNLAVIQKTNAYARGGLVKGREQTINVNEEGEEFVVNAPATRKLGAAMLAKIQAFPERARAVLDTIAFPSINVPTPAFAFATGGSTSNVTNESTIINNLTADLRIIKDSFQTEIRAVKTAIESLKLRADIDSEKMALTVENGNKRVLARKN